MPEESTKSKIGNLPYLLLMCNLIIEFTESQCFVCWAVLQE